MNLDTSPNQQNGWIVNLGHARYAQTLELQQRLVQLRHENTVPDTLLLAEHEPVITMGRRDTTANILATPAELSSQGIQVFQVERGGDVTYHGPGQLVGYPIIHLTQKNIGVRSFVNLLEETIIRTLADYHISAGRHPEHRGVWINDLKVAALGVAVKKGVSFHGFALNVSPNLAHFCYINPCDLKPEKVTSVQALLGTAPGMEEVCATVAKRFVDVFPGQWRTFSSTELTQKMEYS
jgi:lipoyl(octanoyl) transferase